MQGVIFVLLRLSVLNWHQSGEFYFPRWKLLCFQVKVVKYRQGLRDKGIHLPLSLAMEQYLLETSLNVFSVPTITKNFSRHNVLGFENHYLKNSFPLQFCRAIVHPHRSGQHGAQTQELHGISDTRLACGWRIFPETCRDFRGWSWEDFTIKTGLFIES